MKLTTENKEVLAELLKLAKNCNNGFVVRNIGIQSFETLDYSDIEVRLNSIIENTQLIAAYVTAIKNILKENENENRIKISKK